MAKQWKPDAVLEHTVPCTYCPNKIDGRVADFSTKKYGYPICTVCIIKYKKKY